MAIARVPLIAPVIHDLHRKCEANPVGANGKREKGPLDLRNAMFQGVDLSGFDLTDADLSGANLRGAHLEGAQGLEARAIRGADVTGARLPGEIGEFKGVDAVASIAPAVATQFLAILAACLYCLITIAATKDRALVLDTSTQSLPILQTAIPLLGFYTLAPLVLVILLLYLQLNLQRLWEALGTLPAKFPDGRPVDERVHPWVYIQRVRAHYPRLEYTVTARIENYLGSLLGYLAVPVTLIFFCHRIAVMHSVWLTVWHVMLFTLSVLIVLLSWWFSRDALCGAPQSERWRSLVSWPYAWRSGAAALSVVLLAWAAGSLWWGSSANLRGEDLSTKPAGWFAGQADVSQVTGASLAGAKLPGAELHNAFLVNADLSYADLRDARLTGANLRGANLSHANLTGASLEDANLQGAILKGAIFGGDESDIRRVRRAANWPLAHYGQTALTTLGLEPDHEERLQSNNFQRYQLHASGYQGALNFHHAVLHGANFDGVDLTSADFTSADLTSASLKRCNLTKSKFLSATLTHCDLSGANLTDATGLTAPQIKEVVLCKDTSLPVWLQRFGSSEPCVR